MDGTTTSEAEATKTAAPDAARPKRMKMKKPIVRRQNETSAIAFPYVDLDNAISVARSMMDSGGIPCTREQLAGAMKLQLNSGSFIVKTGAARMFGLIESVQGKYQLTQLGFSIVDEAREKAARAEAFLNVPLYRRAYDEFKGKQLPPRPHGLEQAFIKFGIPPKQKRNARLAFEKSARQAGYSTIDPDRLIGPIVGMSMGEPKTVGLVGAGVVASAGSFPTTGRVGTPVSSDDLDQLVQGLLRRLPKPGEKWELEKRARWLQTLAANFDMIYTSQENDKVITVECKTARKPE